MPKSPLHTLSVSFEDLLKCPCACSISSDIIHATTTVSSYVNITSSCHVICMAPGATLAAFATFATSLWT